MAAPRKPAQQSKDRETVARMLAEGKSYRQIAKLTGLALTTVSSDVENIKSAWRNRAADSMAEALGRECAKLDEVERRQWQLLGKVQTPKTENEILEGIARTVSRRCKVLGLEALSEISTMRRAVYDERTAGKRMILETLARHVKDPATLQRIAEDLHHDNEPLQAHAEEVVPAELDYER